MDESGKESSNSGRTQESDAEGLEVFSARSPSFEFDANHQLSSGRSQAIRKALNTGNYDRSDIQTDYFDVGFYAYIHIGKWDKPFQVIPQRKEPTLEELKTRLAELEERAAKTA